MNRIILWPQSLNDIMKWEKYSILTDYSFMKYFEKTLFPDISLICVARANKLK